MAEMATDQITVAAPWRMKQDLDLDMQTIWALLSPKCLRLSGAQVELMDLHKIMLQPLLSLPARFAAIIPKNGTFLVSLSNMENLEHNWKPSLSWPGSSGRVMTDRRQKKKIKQRKTVWNKKGINKTKRSLFIKDTEKSNDWFRGTNSEMAHCPIYQLFII